MVIVMWLINLFSLFSCFGALIILAFIAVKTKKKRFWKLFIITFIYVFSYASGMLYLIKNFGFTIPDIEFVEIIPRNPRITYFFSSLLYLIQGWLIISIVSDFFHVKSKPAYFFFSPLVLMGFLIPDFLLLFFRDILFSYSNFFIIMRLTFGYMLMEYAVVSILRNRNVLHNKLKTGLITMSLVFTLLVIPSMLIEDLVTLYYGMIVYNIPEAMGFLLLMTTLLISGIFYLSIYRKDFSTVSLLDVSEKYGLTEREMDVLKELVAASSASYKEIAQKLNISSETVKTHVSRIYRKLGVSAKQELKYKIRDITS